MFRYRETKIFERKVVIPHFLQKNLKAVVELMFVENFRKLDLCSCEKYASASRPSCLFTFAHEVAPATE